MLDWTRETTGQVGFPIRGHTLGLAPVQLRRQCTCLRLRFFEGSLSACRSKLNECITSIDLSIHRNFVLAAGRKALYWWLQSYRDNNGPVRGFTPNGALKTT